MKNQYKYQRYFLQIAYRGSHYHGWQLQPNAPTIQGEIEHAFQRMNKPVSLVGSSRTDTGVHAMLQVAHVDLPEKVVCGTLRHSLNALLPPAITVRNILPVQPSQHARFGALKRRYIYRITRLQDPFLHGLYYYFSKPLNIEVMNKGAADLLGRHDFSSFCKKKTVLPHYECNVQEATWKADETGYSFYITSNRFLRGMVRSIVGTLLDVGTGTIPPEDIATILKHKDRRKAGRSLPPEGLFLSAVVYPEGFFTTYAETHQVLEEPYNSQSVLAVTPHVWL
ncbi:MAG: tRNA pseudouridine(38-40) synthase TruA [Cytophagales bacterium]